MDLFGQALDDRFNGKSYPFFIAICGEKEEHNLDRYFRSIDKLSKVEKALISMCFGEILDIGCGTGNYIPALEKKGEVVGIDISPKVIDVAKKMGINNCFVADIFSYNESQKYDTITMFENNLGMGGTINKTRKLLRKMANLLKENGQILIILSGRSKEKDYLETELTPIYRGVKGERFQWINFNIKYLRKLCTEIKLNLKVISANRYYSFIKITKE